jgi:RNA polymerase sigma factor (sigma-70 family)
LIHLERLAPPFRMTRLFPCATLASFPALEPPCGIWWMAAREPTVLPRAEAERRFAVVLASAGDAIWRLCRFREHDTDARRDLYQDIALALWQALPDFRGEASERTWALRIAHNVAATHVGRAARQRQRTVPAADEQTLETGSADAPRGIDPERRLDLFARLAALDVPSQQLVLLHLEGLTTREIADVTGLTPTNVTTRLNRLRVRLSGESSDAASSETHATTEGARA